MGKPVVVYTMDYCGFCERAKSMLKQRGIPFDEIRVAMDDDAQWAELHRRSGMRTMPIIFNGDQLVGGYRELAQLDASDQLASLKPKPTP